MEDKITIDRSTFKALAADTRVHILKLLDKRRHTQSELSAELKLSVPTIKEHLEALEKASLVKKHEEGYKWKYYGLTEKAKCLLDPERKKVWIMLAVLLISIGGTIITLSKSMFLGAAKASFASEKLAAEAAPQALRASEDVAVQATVQTASQFPYVLVIFLIATLVVAVLLFYFLFKSKILRHRP
ncbi:winged helix-turn-helix domain-containing protein [Candidatus Woesearchaeota archaeon]|nr:winged helix-turn-helix domain-containing protein [Candidatus Woesearchaeota archaeon]